MSEGVKLPTSFDIVLGNIFSKMFLNPFLACKIVINHLLIRRACLISRTEPSIDEFQLSGFDKDLNLLLPVLVLYIPPHLEEFELRHHEFSLWVREKTIDYRRYDEVHTPELMSVPLFIHFVKVLFDGCQPPDICVRVTNHVDRVVLVGLYRVKQAS